MSKIGCIVSPEGSGKGYIAGDYISVEVVVLTGNKLQGEKNNKCGGHPQEES